MDAADLACAKLVQASDPRRFRAVMAAPVAARPTLFAVYAANLEFARAAWASDEPLIAQMRLQFWHDSLTAIQTDAPLPYPHDILPALQRMPKPALTLLQQALSARNEDLDRHGWPDWDCAGDYALRIAGATLQAATVALGGDPADIDATLLRAHSLLTFFEACPDIAAKGLAVPNGTAAADYIPKLGSTAQYMTKVPKNARAALIETWLRPYQSAMLHKSQSDTAPQPGPAGQSLRLAWAAFWV